MSPMMNDQELESELRRALSRIEPDKDFSAMVYSRQAAGFWTRSRGVPALAAALVIMLLVPAGVVQYQARQRRGEEAREKLVTALRITESKLQKTRQMVVRGLNRRKSL
jgi:hypothetical protein